MIQTIVMIDKIKLVVVVITELRSLLISNSQQIDLIVKELKDILQHFNITLITRFEDPMWVYFESSII